MADDRAKSIYGSDLAFIHDAGFGDFARHSAPGLLQYLQQAGVHRGPVVDAGCGSGVWAQQLANAGYDVRGLDLSPAMIKLAKQRCARGDFRVGSVWTYRFPRCQAITALGEVLCYRVGSRPSAFQLPALLRRMFAALDAPGLLVFDVAEIGLDRHRPPTFVEQADWSCQVRYQYDSRRDRLTRHITTFRKTGGKAGSLYRRSTERHELQLFAADQVADQLREIGFRVRQVRRYGEHALLPGRVGFLARKPATR